MAKNSVSDWDTTRANNTDVGGIAIEGSSSIANGNDAIQEVMEQIAAYTRRGSDLASAGTLDLDSIDSFFLNVTGTTTVTAVTLTSGHVRFCRATGAFQMTASASLIVNGSASVNYTTVAGDLLLFEGYGSSVVRVWLIGQADTPVGLTKTQTLTNKTLTSPVLNTGVSGTAIAAQSDMEAASSTSLIVTPARVKNDPGVAKFWIEYAGNTNTINVSHNADTPLTDNGTGDHTVGVTTDFGTALWSFALSSVQAHCTLAAIAAGSIRIQTTNTANTATDGTFVSAVGFGDQ